MCIVYPSMVSATIWDFVLIKIVMSFAVYTIVLYSAPIKKHFIKSTIYLLSTPIQQQI